jgi:hypothetical protein
LGLMIEVGDEAMRQRASMRVGLIDNIVRRRRGLVSGRTTVG